MSCLKHASDILQSQKKRAGNELIKKRTRNVAERRSSVT